MRRLLPDPGPTTVEEQLDPYRPWEDPREGRPFVAVNFAATVDGRAAIEGVSGPIGSATDTAMLSGLRTRFDAVMIGAGTMRAERYGRLISNQETRARRERTGLLHDPLMVIVSGRLDLPWDAPLFSAGGGRVLVFTASEAEPPQVATSLRIVRHEGFVDLGEAMRHLRHECGIRALLCEGGPGLHARAGGGGAGRRALPDDRAEAGWRRRAADRRGAAAGARRAGAGLAAGARRRAVRPLPAALTWLAFEPDRERVVGEPGSRDAVGRHPARRRLRRSTRSTAAGAIAGETDHREPVAVRVRLADAAGRGQGAPRRGRDAARRSSPARSRSRSSSPCLPGSRARLSPWIMDGDHPRRRRRRQASAEVDR